MSNALQRLVSAVNILPLQESSFTVLNAFLSLFPEDTAVAPLLQLTPDVSLVQCAYLAESEVILPTMLQYLADCGVSDQEFQNLQRICVQGSPPKLGFFLRQEGAASSIGWLLAGPLDVSTMSGYLPKGRVRTALQSWSSAHAVDECLSYARILGPGEQWEELTVSLPSMQAGQAFFEKMNLVWLPEPLLEEAEQGSAALALTIWISTSGGLIRAAIRGMQPSVRLALAARLELPTIAESNLAVLEGYLQVQHPHWVEMGRVAAGRDAILGYTLS